MRRQALMIGSLALALLASCMTAPLHASATTVVLPTGQTVSPVGRITALNAFPTGVAVSPDGSKLVVIAGAALASDGPPVTVEIIDASTGVASQVLHVNDAFQSVAWSADGSNIYVAGGQDGVVHVFTTASGGTFGAGTDVPVPHCTFVSGLALARDGASLWVACALDNAVHHLALPAGAELATYAAAGADQVAVSADDLHVYATDWRGTTTTRIDAATGAVTAIPVGDHPNAVVALPDGRAVVTDTNDATVATLAAPTGPVLSEPPGLLVVLVAIGVVALVLARRRRRPGAGVAAAAVVVLVATTLGVHAAAPAPPARAAVVDAQSTDVSQLSRHSDAPNAVVASPSGDRLYVSLAADNAVAVLVPARGASPWAVAGLIPTGWYPVALALSPDGLTLHVVTARGLASSAAATSPYVTPDPVNTGVNAAYATVGTLETLAVPNDVTLAADTVVARSGISLPGTGTLPPVLGGSSGPVKHIIYITRENKTYDSDLGDLHPGPQTALTLFPRANTPNLHELETGFVESQAFYYPGFRSTVGHMWEDAGGVSDVYERAAGADTKALAGDWRNPTNYPSTGLLVGQVLHAGLTVRTYNEELAQQSTLIPESVQAPQSVFANYDLHISDTSREMGWETEFKQFEAHSCSGDLAAAYGAKCALPSLEYVYLGEDHTTVVNEPGYPSIEAQVADNDYATARVIDAVSHSADWASTLVIVVEDDPQGTGDTMSAYHGFIAMASPYVKRGYISSVHYQLTSVVGAIDAILGLPPLTDYVAQARPLDDLFTNTPDLTPFTADPSGIQLFPFMPLPGTPPADDPAHGINGFAEPDQTNPALAWRSTWIQIKGHPSP